KLVQYELSDGSETVIDASWAGPPESQAHLHCCWSDVRFARLLRTNDAVRKSIVYDWQLCFFATRADAVQFNPDIPNPDLRLFWFYLKDSRHKAVRNLGQSGD